METSTKRSRPTLDESNIIFKPQAPVPAAEEPHQDLMGLSWVCREAVYEMAVAVQWLHDIT